MNNYVSSSEPQLSVVNQGDSKEISISIAYDDVTLHYGTHSEHPGTSSWLFEEGYRFVCLWVIWCSWPSKETNKIYFKPNKRLELSNFLDRYATRLPSFWALARNEVHLYRVHSIIGDTYCFHLLHCLIVSMIPEQIFGTMMRSELLIKVNDYCTWYVKIGFYLYHPKQIKIIAK